MDELDVLEYIDELAYLFEKAKGKIPTINSSTNYWFTRANSGQYFQSFNVGNYIAIGWNEITLEDLENKPENVIKESIQEHYPDSKKPGSAYNQMMKFTYNIRIDDIVIVPSEAPNNLLVGIVTSDPYTETVENIELATNVCTFNKRRNVKWVGIILNKDIDPSLYPLVYSGQTITDANDYKKYINRVLYDSYVEEDTMSITFRVKEEEDVSAFAYNNFLTSTLNMAEVLKEEDNEDVVIRTNVQSNGPLELLGDPNVMATVGLIMKTVSILGGTGLAAYAFKKLLRGGGEITFNKENGFSAKVNGDAEANLKEAEANRINAETDRIKLETETNKLKALLEIAQSEDFRKATSKLQIEIPRQISIALETAIEETIDSDSPPTIDADES